MILTQKQSLRLSEKLDALKEYADSIEPNEEITKEITDIESELNASEVELERIAQHETEARSIFADKNQNPDMLVSGHKAWVLLVHESGDEGLGSQQIIANEIKIERRVLALKAKMLEIDAAAFGPNGANYRENIAFRANNQQPELKPYSIWINEVYNDWYLTAKAAIESGLEVDITSGWPDEPEIRPES